MSSPSPKGPAAGGPPEDGFDPFATQLTSAPEPATVPIAEPERTWAAPESESTDMPTQTFRIVDAASEAVTASPADPYATVAPQRTWLPDETTAHQSGATEVDDPFSTRPTAASSSGHAAQAPRSAQSAAAMRYRVLRSHAKGGLGEVFLARDEELQRDVALKEIQLRHASDLDSRVRFLLEAEITGGLEHPGVVPVYGLGQYPDGRPYYAMRFIKGESFKEAIERFHKDDANPKRDPGERMLALRALLRRFIDTCNAMAYAHSRGVLHRDIKPGNVMLGKYGETLVVDWGLAKAMGRTNDVIRPSGPERMRPPIGDVDPEKTILDEASFGVDALAPTIPEVPLIPSSQSGSTETMIGQALGTPQYMSPEQADGRLDLMGPPSDIYSLGATLYTLLTGKAPIQGKTVIEVLHKVRSGQIEPAVIAGKWVPKPLDAICRKAMAFRPDARYQTATELAEDIEHWMADEPISAYIETEWERIRRWMRRHKTWTQAGAAALVVVAVVSASAAVLVEGARQSEREAERKAQALRQEHDQDVQGRRTRAQALVMNGQSDFLGGKLESAREQLSGAIQAVGDESDLADLRTSAQELLKKVDLRIAEQEAARAAQDRRLAFGKKREEALLHGMQLTGLDPAATCAACMSAGREALALYGLDPAKGPASADGTTLPDDPALRDDAFGLLMLWARMEMHEAGEDRERLKKALGALDLAERLRPPLVASGRLRAHLLDMLGDPDAAGKVHTEADARRPDSALDQYLLADAEYHQGLDESDASARTEAIRRARDGFEATLRLKPDDVPALFSLVACDLSLGRHAEARALLTACQAKKPDFVWTYLLQAFADAALGRTEAADAEFRKALELNPDPDARYALLANRGATWVRSNKAAEAVDVLNEAIRLRPELTAAHVNLSVAYEELKNFDEADREIVRAIKLSPKTAALYRNRARLNLARGDFAQAAQALDAAIALEPPGRPDRAADQYQRAIIRFRAKDYAGTAAECDEALTVRPHDAPTHRLRGEAKMKLRDYAAAAASFGKALESLGASATADLYLMRAQARQEIGDVGGALADFSRAAELDPKSQVQGRRGWLLIFGPELALRDFESAVAASPRDGEARAGLAYTRMKLGQFDQAVADAEASAELGTGSAQVWVNLACVFAQAARRVEGEKAGQLRTRAVAMLEKAMATFPSDDSAKMFYTAAVAQDSELAELRESPEFRPFRNRYAAAERR